MRKREKDEWKDKLTNKDSSANWFRPQAETLKSGTARNCQEEVSYGIAL